MIPYLAGKGRALQFALERLGFDEGLKRSVLVAGDSGNDVSMFECGHRGIVVRNATAELVDYLTLRKSKSKEIESEIE